MRIKINLNIKDKIIDVNYNRYLQAIIYRSLSSFSEINSLHDVGYRIENRPFKMFVYSPIIGKTMYIKETKKIQFLENAYFLVSSSNNEIIKSLILFFEQNNNLLIGKEIIKIHSYELIPNKLKKAMGVYKAISPIVCCSTNNKSVTYFTSDSDELRKSLLNNLAKKYYIYYKEEMPDIKIRIIDNVKEKYVHYNTLFFKGVMFTIVFDNMTYKVHNLILDTGLGSKNSMGCGMMIQVEEKNICL